MSDEHEHQTHRQEDAPGSGMLLRGWITQMTPEELQRQVAKRPPKNEVIATWVILIGVAALVVLGFILSAR